MTEEGNFRDFHLGVPVFAALFGMDRRELLRIENMLRCGKLIAISAVGEPLSRFWHGPTSGQNSIMICGPMSGTARL